MRTPPFVVLAALGACTAPDRAPSVHLGAGATAELRAAVEARATRFVPVDRPAFPALPGFQARSGRLRIHVDEDGLHVVDRAATTPDWVVGLRAVGFGRDGAVAPLPRGSLWAEDASLELARGSVVEFAENTEDGFEHGFHLRRRPDGAGPLRLTLAVDGAEPYATDDGALLLVPGRVTVSWRGLVVHDADGRSLPAHTEVDDRGLSVVVDDAGARWPVTIDPLLAVPEQAFVPSLGVGSPRSGYAVSVDGDRILVGSPGEAGGTDVGDQVTLHARNEGGQDTWGISWTFDQPSFDREGYAVDLEEDLVAVGSPTEGRVDLYRVDADGAYVLGGDLIKPSEDFGAAVALFGDGVAVGAPGRNGDSGRVYLYNRYTGWLEAPETDPPVGGAGDRYGEALDAHADAFLVGAPGGRYADLLHVWGEAGDASEQEQRFLGDPGGSFGAAVALDDGLAIVGDPTLRQVHVFGRTTAGWQEVVVAAPPQAGPEFGVEVAAAGDAFAVLDRGTPTRVFLYEGRAGAAPDLVQVLDTGAVSTAQWPASLSMDAASVVVGFPSDASVHVWRRAGERWVSQDLSKPAKDRFGASLGLDGARAGAGPLLAVGAPGDDGAGVNAGAAYLFAWDAAGGFTDVATLDGAAAGDEFGTGLDVTEDLVVVGSPKALGTGGQTNVGRVDVYAWDGVAPTLLTPTDGLRPTAEEAGLQFGDSVAADALKVLVAAPGYANGTGCAYLYERHFPATDAFGGFPSPSSNRVLVGTAVGDRSGAGGVALEGAWMAAGSGRHDGTGVDVGIVLLQTWRGATFSTPTTFEGVATDERFGAAVALDGGTLAVGAPGYLSSTGRVRLYALDPVGGWTLTTTLSGTLGSSFGSEVALEGDRLLVGLPDSAAARLFLRNTGGADAWGQVAEWTGPSAFGDAVALDGDLVVVGAPTDKTVSVHEWDANVPPLCLDDAFSGLDEDVQGNALVSLNDRDPNDGDVLSYTVVDPPDHAASYALAADGALTYQGAADWSGVDQLVVEVSDGDLTCTSTVTLVVDPVNDPPVAGAVGPYAVDEDQVLSVPAPGLLGGASDVDTPLGQLVVYQDRAPAHGTLTLQRTTGAFTYTPDPDWFGTDGFTFTIRDGAGGATAPVAVSVVVAPVNDPPVLLQTSLTVTGIAEDTVYVSPPPGLGVAATDVDGDPLTVVLRTPPAHGAFTFEPNTYWRYQPDPDWAGTDTFAYAVTDGVDTTPDVDVSLVVDPANDAPVARADGPYAWPEDETFSLPESAVLANDGDVDPGDVLGVVLEPGSAVNGVVSYVGGAFQFEPDVDFAGTASFAYRATDGVTTSDPVTVTVAFTPRNDAPVAVDDDARSDDGAAVSGDVLANDADIDGDALTAALLRPATNGSVTLRPDGSWTYTPRPGFTGEDGFTYAASDPSGASDTAVVTLAVFAAEPTGPTDTGETASGCDEPGTFYADRDGDGFGDPDAPHLACAAGGWVADATDCDDFDAGVFPGARELAADGRDQDCDGRDNAPTPIGACDTAGGPALAPLAAVALLALRRRRTSW